MARTETRRRNQSKLAFLETETIRLEGKLIPHGQLFQLQITLREWSMGREVQSKEHNTGLFLLNSESARTVIATAYDLLERTR